jgi:penicillin-binding protein 1A
MGVIAMAKKKIVRKAKKPIFKRIWNWVFVVLIVGGLSFAGYSYVVIQQAPAISQEQLAALPEASGERKYVTYDQLPARFKDALVATEDRSFETNSGVNINGVLNLFITGAKALIGLGAARGGSSITQQLVKLTVFSTDAKDQTLRRKIQEIWLAVQLTKHYSKDQLLEYYVNKIYEGHNQYGAQSIAYYYYGVPLTSLDTSQLAVIAGLGQSPSRYDLLTNPELVRERRDEVLLGMLQTKKISKDDYQIAKSADVQAGVIVR